MTPDMVNGAFEALAGVAVLNHCRALYEQKQVRGVSIVSIAFFVAWGLWNLYYYPFLDKFWSFVGGVFITLANALYVAMLAYYGGLVCMLRGHDYPGVEFRLNALYFCRRCRREMFDRTLDDLRAMPPIDDERLEDIHREMAMEAEGRR